MFVYVCAFVCVCGCVCVGVLSVEYKREEYMILLFMFVGSKIHTCCNERSRRLLETSYQTK